MAIPSVITFFTAPDDDFILKGARDPLGFQSIWQHTARPLIPYLNTVCGNLRDFQILCLGHVLHSETGEGEDIVPFFIRFEQLMAHTRLRMDPELGFNGVDKTKRLASEEKASAYLGNRRRDSRYPDAELLTNQRSYGIWGKYIKPFESMGLGRCQDFETIFSEKLAAVRKDTTAAGLLKAVSKREGARVSYGDLDALFPLLKLTPSERAFFRQHLLQVSKPAAPQNRLYEFCESGNIPGDFFSLLEALGEIGDAELTAAAEEVRKTEQILCPLNRFFRALQTRRIWDVSDIEGDEYFTACTGPVESDVISDEWAAQKRTLASVLDRPLKEVVSALLRENELVSTRRGGSVWMSMRNNLLEVHHTEGSYRAPEEYRRGVDWDNSYFLSTYVSLYKQMAA